ncbi:MAG: V4R domain-containing protein [Myxococcota bacterium]
MTEKKPEEQRGRGLLGSAPLAFDPDDVLVREPGLLLDPAFLGALREELEHEMGADEARVTLLQMGFLHGLRDSLRVAEHGMAAASARYAVPASSPLPLRVRPRTGEIGLVMEGCWPECSEASVQLSRGGLAPAPCCALSAGYTSGWLSGILDADLLVLETGCAAQGAETCSFVAREAESWLARNDAAAEEALAALPFAAMRELVVREVAETPAPELPGIDPGAAVVHIWGPVMVIPYGGVDEALAAVDLVGRDPGAAEVSVVVVDLTGAIIDEAFGAVALERIVESIESWGGEAILAGASPLSEPVLDGLDRQPLMVQKDLQEAIAAAFRIAESQRRTL